MGQTVGGPARPLRRRGYWQRRVLWVEDRLAGSSPQWRREGPGAGPWWIQSSPGPPGTEHHSQEPLIWVIWSPVCGGTLSTDVNTCGGDAPIAVARPGDVNP
jgi:hypothetical protein